MDFRDTPIRTGGRSALELDAHNLRVKILRDAWHVIAIECGEKLCQYFYFVVLRSPSNASIYLRFARTIWVALAVGTCSVTT